MTNVANQSHPTCDSRNVCHQGLMLPLWYPLIDEDTKIEVIVYRAFVYFFALMYCLFGVAIVAERIVAATEVIASHKREVKVKTKSGAIKIEKVLIWHPVVAALLFGTPSTSSPEILLPFIDVFHRNFHGDELGPSLIVGSGAYHLFVITSICLLSIRTTTPKPIKDVKLFLTSAFFAVIAYLWVYLILDQISPAIIELWEALVTLIMFPVLIVTMWFVSCRHHIRFYRYVRKRICARVYPDDYPYEDYSLEHTKRRQLAAILLKLKKENQDKSREDLEAMAEEELLDTMPKTAFFYRQEVTSRAMGHVTEKRKLLRAIRKVAPKNSLKTTVGFVDAEQKCLESCGVLKITVQRLGIINSDKTLIVDCQTVEGTAKANVNFMPLTETKLKFPPGQRTAEVAVTIISDEVFEPIAKTFKVRLTNPILQGSTNVSSNVTLATSVTTVSLIDDDHCGVFSFEKPEEAVPDKLEVASFKVVRAVGLKGVVTLPFRLLPGTAKEMQDYIPITRSQIEFEPGQSEATIDVGIVDKDRSGQVATFFVELLPPRKVSGTIKDTIGDPVLGDCKLLQVGICEDEELTEALDRLIQKTDFAHQIVKSTWKTELLSTFRVFPHYDKPPSRAARAYIIVMYILAFPWRFAASLLPPPGIFNGYLAYVSYMGLMALVAGLIGDCSTYLGCTIGLKNTITAITIIPIGMGLPDTFSSRRAAMMEKTADAAIGGITFSNAATNFLGMGLAWTVGSAYRLSKGEQFKMPPSDLGFSVMLYCSFAAVYVVVLLLRRLPPVRGELGGPKWAKYSTSAFFIALWILFVTLSILENYCVIEGFVNKSH